MEKKTYSKPRILHHGLIKFETGLSNCIEISQHNRCLKPDHTWIQL